MDSRTTGNSAVIATQQTSAVLQKFQVVSTLGQQHHFLNSTEAITAKKYCQKKKQIFVSTPSCAWQWQRDKNCNDFYPISRQINDNTTFKKSRTVGTLVLRFSLLWLFGESTSHRAYDSDILIKKIKTAMKTTWTPAWLRSCYLAQVRTRTRFTLFGQLKQASNEVV